MKHFHVYSGTYKRHQQTLLRRIGRCQPRIGSAISPVPCSLQRSRNEGYTLQRNYFGKVITNILLNLCTL